MSPDAWGAGLSGTADDVSSDVTSTLRNPFSSGVGEMINTFSMSAYKVGLKVNPNEQDPRVPVLSWSTCAYTMQSIGTRHLAGWPAGHLLTPHLAGNPRSGVILFPVSWLQSAC